MYKIFTFFIFWIAGIATIQAQILHEYTFEDQTGKDWISVQDLIISGNPTYDCGVQDFAISLDGIDDYALFPQSNNKLFNREFTLGFNFWVRNPGDNPVDLISYMKGCDRDSLFSITYIPVVNEVLVEISQQLGISLTMRGTINPDQCWHYMAFSSDGENFTLYLDGKLADQVSRSGVIEFSELASLQLSNNPCIGSLSTVRLNGLIDEFFIYEGLLSEIEIDSLNFRADQILNRDTTIFLGDAIQILTGGTCASSFSWSPSSGVSDVFSLEPIIQPTESEIYVLDIDHGSCIASDTFDLKVIDPNELTCDELKMPNAFTPNGDGINDIFTISNDFIIEELKAFEVFDRWGNKVFETNQKLAGWDGYFKNQPVNPGTYLFKVDYQCKGQEFFNTGSFTVIR
jgi:gliding motility-associated-like protein